MAKTFVVTVIKRVFYDEVAKFQVEADSSEDANKKATKYVHKEGGNIEWAQNCLTKRPRPKITSVEEVVDASAADAPVADAAPSA